MESKTALYKGGKTIIVDAAKTKAFAAKLNDGWSDSPDDLGDLSTTETTEFSRKELEGAAKEYGIAFNSRTSDKKLLERIEAHIEANEV